MEKRTVENMKRRRSALRAMSVTGQRGCNERAVKRAKQIGVNLEITCPWTGGNPLDWVFGPCRIRDNLFQCMPQVNLHGFDEGLVIKLNFGVVELFIEEVKILHNLKATPVSKM
jgi:hypothetical protein